jgi:hypothetical protein
MRVWFGLLRLPVLLMLTLLGTIAVLALLVLRATGVRAAMAFLRDAFRVRAGAWYVLRHGEILTDLHCALERRSGAGCRPLGKSIAGPVNCCGQDRRVLLAKTYRPQATSG